MDFDTILVTPEAFEIIKHQLPANGEPILGGVRVLVSKYAPERGFKFRRDNFLDSRRPFRLFQSLTTDDGTHAAP